MERSPSLSLVFGLIALLLIFCISTSTFLKLYKRAIVELRGTASDETAKLYEDQDGIATEETQKEYSATVPKSIALWCSLLGFSASMSIAIYSTVHPALDLYVEHWLSFGTWVRLCIAKSLLFPQINASVVMSCRPDHIHRPGARLCEEIQLWMSKCIGLCPLDRFYLYPDGDTLLLSVFILVFRRICRLGGAANLYCCDMLSSMSELAQTPSRGRWGYSNRRPVHRFSARPIFFQLGWGHPRLSPKKQNFWFG